MQNNWLWIIHFVCQTTLNSDTCKQCSCVIWFADFHRATYIFAASCSKINRQTSSGLNWLVKLFFFKSLGPMRYLCKVSSHSVAFLLCTWSNLSCHLQHIWTFCIKLFCNGLTSKFWIELTGKTCIFVFIRDHRVFVQGSNTSCPIFITYMIEFELSVFNIFKYFASSCSVTDWQVSSEPNWLVKLVFLYSSGPIGCLCKVATHSVAYLSCTCSHYYFYLFTDLSLFCNKLFCNRLANKSWTELIGKTCIFVFVRSHRVFVQGSNMFCRLFIMYMFVLLFHLFADLSVFCIKLFCNRLVSKFWTESKGKTCIFVFVRPRAM